MVLDPEYSPLPVQSQGDLDGLSLGGEAQGIGQEIVEGPLSHVPVQIAHALPGGRGVGEPDTSLCRQRGGPICNLPKKAAQGSNLPVGLPGGEVLTGIGHVVDDSQELKQPLVYGGHLVLEARSFRQLQLGEEPVCCQHGVAKRLPELPGGQSQLVQARQVRLLIQQEQVYAPI